MFLKPRWSAVLVLAAASLAVTSARGDFDPNGRHHGRPHRPARPHHPVRPHRPVGHATASSGRSPEVLIARYRGLVLARPGEPFPLRRLAELVRKRDGDLDKLRGEFTKLVNSGGAEAWAAKVALAGMARMDGKKQEAISLYREAISARPKQLGPVRALAEVLTDAGKLAEARKLYEQLFAQSKARVDKETALRTLLKLALDQKDYEGAKGYHAKLVRLAQGSFFVRAELTRELMARGRYDLAEQAARALVKASAGDNRVLVLALRDLGRALVKEGKTAEATTVLRRALRLAGRSAGVRREIYRIITEAYRAEGKLRDLIALLRKQRGARDFQRLVTLGGLLEETGQIDDALKEYRAALRVRPKHTDTRLRVIHLLQAQGQLDEAIKAYERLIRATPSNPDFVFELCDLLIQRGERKKAKGWLQRWERHAHDDDQLARLADFYEQIEESERAMRIWKRLAAHNGRNPRFVVELGNRYFDQGDVKKAKQIWERLRGVVGNRAKALTALGEVYLEHDMVKDALKVLLEAVKLRPNDIRTLKTYAMALERSTPPVRRRLSSGRRKALVIWHQILTLAEKQGRTAQAREARMHIVASWALTGQLGQHEQALQRTFQRNPQDEQSARMLVEVQVRLRHLDKAAATLEQLVAQHPGEASLMLRLERVLVLDHKLEQAIDVLKRLVRADPQRARSYYQRMAKYASELYQDEDALRYAAKAVALAPDDAEGHRKLGELYRKRQQVDKAIGEFRAAIAKNDRLFLVYFDLAKLLVGRNQLDKADELYRRVVRLCPDESLVVQAARLSMQINMGRGTLERLERELLPTALNNPQKTVYRKLLVELYGAMTLPLVQQVRYGDHAKKASAALAKIGQRAVKPLLDALADDDETQQRVAIQVLGFVQNKAASSALFAYATGQGNGQLRLKAMLAAGSLQDPRLIAKFEKLLAPKLLSTAGDVHVAAAWGLTKLDAPKAFPVLRSLARKGSPPVRAMCLLSLGRQKDRRSASVMLEMLRDPSTPDLARAASALALAQLGGIKQVDVLPSLTFSPNPIVRQSAIVALAKLAPDKARDIAVGALFDPDADVRAAALGALTYAVNRRPWTAPDLWTRPQGEVDVRKMLARAVPPAPDATARVNAFITLLPRLERAARTSALTSEFGAKLVAQSLLSRPGHPGFAPFTDGLGAVDPVLRGKAVQAARKLTQKVAPGFATLTDHPDASLRKSALRVLALQGLDEHRSLLVRALTDPEESVRELALDLLGEARTKSTALAVARVLQEAKRWPLRMHAARVLAAYHAGHLPEDARTVLQQRAEHDEIAFVRLACVQALQGDESSRAILQRIAKGDEEPAVRRAATQMAATPSP